MGSGCTGANSKCPLSEARLITLSMPVLNNGELSSYREEIDTKEEEEQYTLNSVVSHMWHGCMIL